VEDLALLVNRHAVPADHAFLEIEHAHDRLHQAGLAAAVGPLEDQ
jgi:hypothetical protein